MQNKAQETDGFDPTRQVVDCGAVVRLDDAVLEHGILFVHPELPLFKLYMQIDLVNKKISKYAFDLVKPETDQVTHFAVRLREVAEPSIIMPEDKKFII